MDNKATGRPDSTSVISTTNPEGQLTSNHVRDWGWLTDMNKGVSHGISTTPHTVIAENSNEVELVLKVIQAKKSGISLRKIIEETITSNTFSSYRAHSIIDELIITLTAATGGHMNILIDLRTSKILRIIFEGNLFLDIKDRGMRNLFVAWSSKIFLYDINEYL